MQRKPLAQHLTCPCFVTALHVSGKCLSSWYAGVGQAVVEQRDVRAAAEALDAAAASAAARLP